MNRFQIFGLSAACGFMLISLTGCVPLLVGAAVGAGGVTYVNGALVRNIDETVKDVHKASLDALKELDYFITQDELNKRSAAVLAETEKGKKIRINIEALTEYVSEIRIRVGMFGDQDLSHEILSAIEKRL